MRTKFGQIPPSTLAMELQQQAGLLHLPRQLHIHYRANFITLSTPSEARANCYMALTPVEIHGQAYRRHARPGLR